MSAPQRILTQAIVNALLEWRGDVSAAARALGLARNSLYERIKRLGLDLDGFRNVKPGNPVTPITQVIGDAGMRRPTGPEGVAQKTAPQARAIYPPGARGRRLDPVQQRTSTEANGGEPVRIKTAPRRPEPIRLRPDLRDRLQRGVWRLQAHFQEPTNENLILEQLVEETLDAWIRSKLEPPAAIPKRRADEGSGR